MIYHNKVFRFVMGFIMILLVLACILPFLLLISSSFTSEQALALHGYSFIPSEFSLAAYTYIWSVKENVLRAYAMSFIITGVGTVVSIVMTMLFAYPLSKKGSCPEEDFYHLSFSLQCCLMVDLYRHT